MGLLRNTFLLSFPDPLIKSEGMLIRGIQKHFTDEPRWLLDCPVKPDNDKVGISQQS